MAGQYAVSLPLNAFSSAYQNNAEPSYVDYSPASLQCGQLDDFGTDFTTDSEQSQNSPLSATFPSSYALPQESDWVAWDRMEHSPDLECFKAEPLDSPLLSSVPFKDMSLSPSVNPMDLTNPTTDDVLFGRDGINDFQPLFQTRYPVQLRSQPAIDQIYRTIPAPISNRRARQPQPAASRPCRPSLKRKSSSVEEDDDHLSERSSPSPPPAPRRSSKEASGAPAAGPKKTAHNMIEKRYRTNLNDKIAALRDAVPALRVMVHRLEAGHENASEGDEAEDEGAACGAGLKAEAAAEDLGGLAPAHKLNKATILGKATEYIVHLERKNQRLAQENAALRGRVQGFEMLVMSRGGSGRHVELSLWA